MVVQGESNPHWPNKLGQAPSLTRWPSGHCAIGAESAASSSKVLVSSSSAGAQVMLHLGGQKPAPIKAIVVWTTPGRVQLWVSGL